MDNKNTIDTSKLEEGTWVKNFKELCTLLNQPVGTGNQKKKQLTEFSRYFAYEKSGNKFFITEIYSEPLPPNVNTPHNSKYVQYIENILLSYLSEQEEEQINIKKSELYSLLGMVNDKYYLYHNNKKLLEILPELTEADLNDFYQRCDDRLNKILGSSLNSLKRRSLMDYYETYIIGAAVSVDSATEIVEYHEANDYERQLVLRIRREALQELGMEIESEVHYKKRETEYYELLNEKMNEYGWLIAFKSFHFIFNQDHVRYARDKAIAKDKDMEELNRLVIEALNTQAENRYEKEQKVINQLAIVPVIKLRYPKEYVTAQKVLSKSLVKI